MSIAAISRTFSSTVRTEPASVEAVDAIGATARAARQHGRRHDLVDAMSRVLEIGAEPDKAQSQAVFRFAQALMHDLRSLDGTDDAATPGRALGRREWGDLGQRLQALASAARNEATETPDPVTPATVAVHLMKVPSSHLVEAFVAVQQALGRVQPADATQAREGLATLACDLAGAMAPDAGSELPAGSVLHVTA
ncbi:MAG TPA: hypothetical protein VFQ16_04970 [Burkholderiaceae bacterium]|nr:hypothetical protein [Burkholderiaceae bacterium]